MTPTEFNALPTDVAQSTLQDCCGSKRWAARMAERRPFPTMHALNEAASTIWQSLGDADWLEAFSHHPQIGRVPTTGSLSARNWAAGEQGGTRTASENMKVLLAEGNRAYFEKFGHIFIVCATGKSAEDMLALLNQRIQNDPAQELSIAVEQQRLIMLLRLEKLFAGGHTI